MKRSGSEAALVDIGKGAAQSGVTHTQEVVIRRGRLKRRDERECIETAAVVMDLAFDSLKFSTVDIVPGWMIGFSLNFLGKRDSPVASSITAISPMGDQGLICENRIERVGGRGGVVEIFAPCVYSFLAS